MTQEPMIITTLGEYKILKDFKEYFGKRTLFKVYQGHSSYMHPGEYWLTKEEVKEFMLHDLEQEMNIVSELRRKIYEHNKDLEQLSFLDRLFNRIPKI